MCLESLYFEPLHGRRDGVREEAKNTTQWIRRHRIYHDWRERSSSLLWVHGKAGSGKSTLAASLQRSLYKDAHNIVVADFFYNISGKPVQNGHLWMLRSILYQILEKKQALYRFYKPFFRKAMANSHEPWKYDLLEETLLRLQDATSDGDHLNFLFIIDGLDESEDGEDPGTSREHFAHLLSKLCESKAGNIFQIIVLSRPEPSIRLILNPAYSIDMKEENYHDIERIVRYGISIIDKRLHSGPNGPLMIYNSASTNVEDVPDITKLNFIKDYLLEHADGVILWVVLVLREMESIANDGADSIWQLKMELDKFPIDLARTYEGMLERLKARKPWNLQKSTYVFSWLFFGEYTITLCEMREVLAMFGWCDYSDDTRRNFLDEHSILQQEDPWNPTWKQLSYLCGGFIEIIPQGRCALETLQGNGALDSDDSVQLIHRTAKEFLLNRSESEFSGLNGAHGADPIITACVDYMELLFTVDHSRPMESWNDLFLYLQKRPLLRYILRELPAKLAVHPNNKNPTAIRSYKKIIEYIVEAWRIRLYPAIWFFERWEHRVLNDRVEHRFDLIVDRLFNELLSSIGLGRTGKTEILRSFSVTLESLGYFGFNDISYLRELRETTLRAETEDTRVRSDYVSKYDMHEGVRCAIESGNYEAIKIFEAAGQYRNNLPHWWDDSIESEHPKIVRAWIGDGEDTRRLFRGLHDAVFRQNEEVVKALLTFKNMERFWEEREYIEDLARSLDETETGNETTIKSILQEYLALMDRSK